MIKYFGIDITVDSAFFVDGYVEALLWKIIDAGITSAAKYIEKKVASPEYYDAQSFQIHKMYRVYPKGIGNIPPIFLKGSHRVYVFETTVMDKLLSDCKPEYLLTVMYHILTDGKDTLQNNLLLINKEQENVKALTFGDVFLFSKYDNLTVE